MSNSKNIEMKKNRIGPLAPTNWISNDKIVRITLTGRPKDKKYSTQEHLTYKKNLNWKWQSKAIIEVDAKYLIVLHFFNNWSVAYWNQTCTSSYLKWKSELVLKYAWKSKWMICDKFATKILENHFDFNNNEQ